MPTARVGDVSIYYEIHGEGEALVLINGYGASSERWFLQVPHFSQEYRVVTFDNRGTGRSDKPDIPYTMEMMAGDIEGLLVAAGIDVAHIYGISMGGMIAQEFALHYPERVLSLILGCTHCGGIHRIQADAEVRTLLFDMERREQQTPEEHAREALPYLYSQESIDNNPDVIELSIAKALEYITPPHGYVSQAQAIMDFDSYDRLSRIKAPTLVIAGDADRIVPMENSKLLASGIPNAELTILEDRGHCYFIGAAEESDKVVLQFLRRHRRSD